MKKLGVLFSGPGPCSLPENTYSIPAICVKVVKEKFNKLRRVYETKPSLFPPGGPL